MQLPTNSLVSLHISDERDMYSIDEFPNQCRHSAFYLYYGILACEWPSTGQEGPCWDSAAVDDGDGTDSEEAACGDRQGADSQIGTACSQGADAVRGAVHRVHWVENCS